MNGRLLVTLLVLGSLTLAVGSYEVGRRMRHLSDVTLERELVKETAKAADGGAYVQAMLAFGHYKTYARIADFLEKKCYDAALTEAKEMRNAQVVLLADNLPRTGNDPALVESIKLRDAELLKSVLAGHTPELRPYTTTCPEPRAGS